MFVFVLAILALYFLRADYRFSGYHADYASARSAMPVKGVFILLVFASHFILYVHPEGFLDKGYMEVRRVLGQMIVVPFLFYSGFGVVERIRAAGEDYLRTFVVKRLVKTVVLFDVAVLLYIALRTLFLGAHFTGSRTLLCLLGWNSAGNSNWYIFTIVLLYLLTYLSFRAFGHLQGRRREVWSVAGVTAAAAVLVGCLAPCRPDYVYNTVFAYVAGCWFSLCRVPLEEALFARGRACLFGLALAAGGFLLLNPFRGTTATCELLSVVFAFGVVLVTTRVKSRSVVLDFAGRHLFSIYILQRLPMLLLQKTAVAQNRYVYFAACLAITLAVAPVFDAATAAGWKLLGKGAARLFRRGA